MATAKPDWDAIKSEFVSGKATTTAISKKYGVSESTIYAHARNEQWRATREKVRRKTEEKYVNQCARARARELTVISSAAEKMAALLDRTVDELSEMPAESRTKSLKGLAAVASAISANTATLINLYGIQSPAQIESQRIARERLELDKRRQAYEEAKTSDETAGADISVNIQVVSPDGLQEADGDGA